MQISSTKFIKGLVQGDETLNIKYPQIAFIGRSNVGKSSTINALTKTNDLARTSALPGRTQEVNVFLINNRFYLVDLPGYGYAKMSRENRNKLQGLINWYLFVSAYQQEVIVLIIDAYIGPTKDDLEMLHALENAKKNIIIAANKVDKIKKSDYVKQFKKIQELIGDHKIFPYSSKTKDGLGQLINEILEK